MQAWFNLELGAAARNPDGRINGAVNPAHAVEHRNRRRVNVREGWRPDFIPRPSMARPPMNSSAILVVNSQLTRAVGLGWQLVNLNGHNSPRISRDSPPPRPSPAGRGEINRRSSGQPATKVVERWSRKAMGAMAVPSPWGRGPGEGEPTPFCSILRSAKTFEVTKKGRRRYGVLHEMAKRLSLISRARP